MTRTNIIFVAAVAVLISSCGLAGHQEIEYTVAKHYFFNGDAEAPESPMVTSQEDFDLLYGKGAVMGRDGQPTEIDFSKQFVVGIVLPETDDYTTIVPGTLVKQKDTLTLHYSLEYGEKDMTWTMRPMALVVVDRKYLPSECVLEEDK